MNSKADYLRPSKLQAASLRPTHARLCVLEVLEDEPQRWIESEAVFRELITRGTAISITTVYRVIKDFEYRGILLREWRVDISGRKAFYKLNSDDPQDCEDIIVCRQCESSAPIDDSALHERLRQLASRRGLTPAKRPITIYVTCDRCTKTPGKKSSREKNISPLPRYSMSLRHAKRRENEESNVAPPVE
ncbi:MAG: transcriptional repressor [Nitrosomonas sp.]|nr:transcriptional repressor [Nitrosomonas sp.]